MGIEEPLDTPQGIFPDLGSWEPTRKTLHLYSNILGAVARAHADPHPKWWHVGLEPKPDGLWTEPMTVPGGGKLRLALDLEGHRIVLSVGEREVQEFDMTAGSSATEMGDEVLGAVEALGSNSEVDRQRFDDEEQRSYNTGAAERFWRVLTRVEGVLQRHRATLDGEVSPIQLWPHGFDLSFEWFGARTERHEERGEVEQLPSQINFGFYPAEPAYFYANPWPFEAQLVNNALPNGARWHEEGWQGTMLPYAGLIGDPAGADKLLAYYSEVHRVASPTLL